jgi:N-methylhydantoinase B
MSAQAQATASVAEGIDPITYEVVRHKLQAIAEEQAITLKAVSGSPVVTEATDFNTGLYLADGSIVTMGPQVIFHTGTMSSVIRSIIRNCSRNPGIREGDMFILNDPYQGAIHQPDVSIVAPIFHDGQLIAWAGSCAHQLDTGGMSFGSWAYQATEVQQEALLLPGVKLVEGGELREDIWAMIMGMTRLPHVVGLDFKAMIAANHVATRRLKELMARYGADTVEAIMKGELDNSERRLRERLKQIPDGIYRARDFLEHDGHSNRLYEVAIAVEKRGDSLVIDMEGTSPQAPGFINCTYSGMKGALFAGLLPILAPDIRWNEGILRVATIKVPDGVICNAEWPTPVSGATISTAWVVANVTIIAMSRMTGFVPDLSREGQAVTKGQFTVVTLAGRDRDGGPFGFLFMDSMAGGGGAFVDHDGLNGSGDYSIPRPAIANVEANEASGPLLYLYRSFMKDTAGPGRMRGGYTAGLAFTPHDADELKAMVVGHGVEVPNSAGVFGGLPGSTAHNFLRRQAGKDIGGVLNAVHSPHDLLADAERLGAKPGNMVLKRGDVFGDLFQGGGGYGDPIRRDPALVAAEIADGLLSPDVAAEFYGVVTHDGAVDAAATSGRRDAIRRARHGGKAPKRAPAEAAAELPDLRIDAARRIVCACGCDLAGPGEDWKARAVRRELKPEDIGRFVRLHVDLTLYEFSCPECATLLEVEVCRKDEPPLASIVLAPGRAN